MFGLGFTEIIVILAIALIFIGPKKLPELAKTLGRGLKEFQGALKGISQDIRADDDLQNSHSHDQHQGPRYDSVIEVQSENQSEKNNLEGAEEKSKKETPS